MSGEHVGEVIDLYALDALESGERDAVDRHLETCAECRGSLSDVRQVVNLLAWAPERRDPPPELHGKVRRRVEQLQRAELSTRARPARSRWRGPRFSLRNGVVAAACTLLLALAGWNVSLQRQLTTVSQQLAQRQQVDAIFSGAGVRTVTLAPQPAAPDAWGSLVVNPSSTEAYLVAKGLPQLPPDKAYQLWLAYEGGRANGGVFRPDDRGAATLLVNAPDRLKNYIRSGITIEPLGGSPGPTGDAVLRSQPWDKGGW